MWKPKKKKKKKPKKTSHAEINLDRRTRPMDLFIHEIYDLFESECARIPNRSYLAAIMNLLSNSSSLYPEASLHQLTADARGRGRGGGGVRCGGEGWGGVGRGGVLQPRTVIIKQHEKK